MLQRQTIQQYKSVSSMLDTNLRLRIELEKKKRELIEQTFPKGRSNQYTAKSEDLTLQNVGITRNESSNAKIIKEEPEIVEEVMNEIEKSNETPF